MFRLKPNAGSNPALSARIIVYISCASPQRRRTVYLAQLIQEREAAACEIERLRNQQDRSNPMTATPRNARVVQPPAPKHSTDERQPLQIGRIGSLIRGVQTREPISIVDLFAGLWWFIPSTREAVRPLCSVASGRPGGMDTTRGPEAEIPLAFARKPAVSSRDLIFSRASLSRHRRRAAQGRASLGRDGDFCPLF